ncbi:uncharacterized protein LOC6561981 [Drosophila grimshawi]|uniref:GH11615 n=1 Tax=Drosophila grimshawi TaxID=7222 RepID=B4JC04_DROGR|nr:uncharacterized protein LOC6561981 [Drosophila grimshawi]EDW04107.1 GH11615 [Drosophila grimshawi]
MWFKFTLFLLVDGVLSARQSRFVNVECKMLDPSYATYKKCNLKILGRGVVALNVHAVLQKGPFNNAKVNVCLFRKFNGYRPFMFNTTVDYCKLMADRRKQLSFPKIVRDSLANCSNLNHTCPYEHDIIVDNMVFDETFFKYLPLPTGDYKIQIMAATDNEWKTIINIYIQWVFD